jgi:hypothetical protein
MRSSFLALSLFAFGTLALSGSAANAQLSYTVDATPISLTKTDFELPLFADKFDSSLGTLTSVQMDLFVRLTSNITVTNITDPMMGQGSEGTIATQLFGWLNDPLGILTDPAVNGAGVIQPGSFVAQVDTLEVSYPTVPGTQLQPGESVAFNNLESSNSTSATFVDPNFLVQFNGSAGEQIVFTGKTRTRTLLSFLGGNTRADQDTSAEMRARITYNYTPTNAAPIPEPTTIGLLALGLSAGTIALRRRRA